MGDFDEGEVPYAGRFCICGLTASHGGVVEPGLCPDCGASWPDMTEQRCSYDGGPEIRTNPVLQERERKRLEKNRAAIEAAVLAAKEKAETDELHRAIGEALLEARALHRDWGGAPACTVIAGFDPGPGQVRFSGWEVRENLYDGPTLLETLRTAIATKKAKEKKP